MGDQQLRPEPELMLELSLDEVMGKRMVGGDMALCHESLRHSLFCI